VPYSFWRHFYDQESTAQGLAEAMVGWVRSYDFDFLKVNPRAEYHAEAWGATFQYSTDQEVKHRRLSYPVVTRHDWHRIRPLKPTQGSLGEQLEAIRLIVRRLGPDRPVIETVFSPLSVAADLVESDEAMVHFLREDPDLVHGALQAIAETFSAFVAECLNAGAHGIFFATTRWARKDILTLEEYNRFGRPYDLKVLAAASGGAFNVLHVCGPHSYLVELSDYPVHAINWAATEASNPKLWQFRVPGKASVGGISNKALTVTTPNTVLAEAKELLEKTGGRGIIVAGDCSIPVNSRDTNLRALYDYLNVYSPGEV
jgi:uroporphyrinogen decarboxylase